MTRLLITRPMPDAVAERARALFDVEMRDSNAPLNEEELRAALTEYDLVMPTLGDAFSAKVFETAQPRARLLANFGVGFNHIDVAAATKAGVAVSNTPGAVTDATADTAMTLMLMSARRAAEGERLVRSGAWQGWHPTQMLGLHLTGKKLGVLGMGRIGQAIAKRAHLGFDMSVHYVSRSSKTLPFPAQRHDDVQALAAAVDVLVVAVPGGAETRHLVDGAVLAAMRPAAHLVNIARGDVVDEAALIAELEAGRIGGAGLDVYEREPDVPEALRKLDNVTLLPHLGTAALEVRVAMGHLALDNLEAFSKGQPAPNMIVL